LRTRMSLTDSSPSSGSSSSPVSASNASMQVGRRPCNFDVRIARPVVSSSDSGDDGQAECSDLGVFLRDPGRSIQYGRRFVS
jgi:hypothetical protein